MDTLECGECGRAGTVGRTFAVVTVPGGGDVERCRGCGSYDVRLVAEMDLVRAEIVAPAMREGVAQ